MLNYFPNNRSCPGFYCGKISINGTCGACEKGYISDSSSICIKCFQKLLLYDWLFLGFIIIQPIIFNFYFTVKLSIKLKSNSKLWILRLFMFCKSLLSFLISLMLFEPVGMLQITKCSTNRLSDWYTMFYNPKLDFVNTVYCTQEAVYPLKSLVVTFYCISILMTVAIRPLIILFVIRDSSWFKSIYYTLYLYPVLTILYFAFGGTWYYSYGYIIFVTAIVVSAGLFSTLLLQNLPTMTIGSVVKATFMRPQNFLLVGCTWLALFYGIISITELRHPTYYGLLFAVIPLPYVLFCLSLHFTNPTVEVYTII